MKSLLLFLLGLFLIFLGADCFDASVTLYHFSISVTIIIAGMLFVGKSFVIIVRNSKA